ncbi:hypothetical protein [Nostoc sp.]|uniref:hypothetical protein n=1 Tax=Nostoc sp. TaxID=1180 RepID=UPI002FF8FAE1
MGEPLRSSPYSLLGILRQALASPFGRRRDAKGDSVLLRGSKLARASRRERLGSPQVEQVASLGEFCGD